MTCLQEEDHKDDEWDEDVEEEPPLDGLHVGGRRQELGHGCVEGVHHWKHIYICRMYKVNFFYEDVLDET